MSAIGLLPSVNQGKSWDFVKPTVVPARALAIDMNLGVDRDTGRVFWSSDFTGLSVLGITSCNGYLYIDYGLAPLGRAALLARKLVRSSVQLAVVPPLLLYVANFRD